MTQPRTAIVTSAYLRPGETFVNHHVDHLFGGNTVVVAMKRGKAWPGDQPVLILDDTPAGAAGRLLAPLHLARHSVIGTPAGRQAAALRDFLRAQRIEAVLCEFGNRAAQVAPVANALGIPVFTYFRGFDGSKLLEERFYPRAFRLLMPRLAGVFAVSHFLLENLASKGITHPNAHVIPSGADTTRFTPGVKQPGYVVAIGRMVEKKQPLTTLRAFIAAAKANPDTRFEMIGGGELLARCREEVAVAGLADRIALPGALPHADVADRLSRATIFAQHSVTGEDGNTEGLPSVIQEAMACGCAVVSTRHAGIPEAVREGDTGLLVDEHDEAGYAAALDALLADPDRTAGMGAAGRAFAVANLDKATLTARIEEVMRAAL
ncbi:glycosyltransferase [Allosediminivita pacifica]|uniref:Glycosyltransferase involved in cell wall biosynthesis n=1 Tax=Allosediminivita pacifica TaxID=1267769 RepID=A0A2T6B140_9RHOB|nr:glycosyltransferase [Allosediminivita pacifica]PTX49781.1 glycosyltransferase involved in cell wall biosynthesis [Allosediminivita pacifica]GGB04560.1 hypothetical protein GCM10011324_13470 [Allosediminivita pacifica]